MSLRNLEQFISKHIQWFAVKFPTVDLHKNFSDKFRFDLYHIVAYRPVARR
jgi:hypothetical protein